MSGHATVAMALTMTALIPLSVPADPKWYLVRTLRYREAGGGQGDRRARARNVPAVRNALRQTRPQADQGQRAIVPAVRIHTLRHRSRPMAPRPPALLGRLHRRRQRNPATRAGSTGRSNPLAEQAGAYDATTLPKGTRVRILEGPFAGFIAEVRRASPRRRVELLLEFLGQQARIPSPIALCTCSQIISRVRLEYVPT